MKRAEVFRARAGEWWAFIWDGPIPDRDERIIFRDNRGRSPVSTGEHPTHAAALAHALTEIGLDRPAEHREAP